MTTRMIRSKGIEFVGLCVANFSAWWGFGILPIYAIGFGLLRAAHGALPLELPVIGLLLSAAGLMLSVGERREAIPGLVGMTLNGVSMVLALLLWAARGGI